MAGWRFAAANQRIDYPISRAEAAGPRFFCVWGRAEGESTSTVDEERIIHGFSALEAIGARIRPIPTDAGSELRNRSRAFGLTSGRSMEERRASGVDPESG